ncbi:MAG TPA: VOC family protein, partial [Vicinamibacterales bacterium]|nr:VOC family protein [Vicinamibacterales bacterium]
MDERQVADRLDNAIQAMLATHEPPVDRELEPYLSIARALRDLARPSFRARLKANLLRRTNMTVTSETVTSETVTNETVTNETVTIEPLAAVRQTATPALRVKNAAAAIEFYKTAFGARELMRFTGHGRVAHAEIAIGNSIVMLGEEAVEYGFPGPETLGGSPVLMRLYVDDADAWVERAVAAGARLVIPVADQFYGDRSGSVADPFGHRWSIATRKEDMSVDEMQRRMAAMEAQQPPREAATFIAKGFRTVTPYLVVEDAPALIEFTTRVFGAEETHRSAGSGGAIHAEVRIGDSMVMIGGGSEGRPSGRPSMPTALHVYVEDTDAAYARALDAGAASIGAPVDHEYGERGAGVKDRSGNVWYIATAKGERYVPAGLNAVNVYLHPRRADPVIKFMERAFGATGVEKYASPDGVVHHAHVTIGDSVVEMGEAQGPYQPMPTMFYLYVPNVEAS